MPTDSTIMYDAELLHRAEEIAQAHHDGHLSLLRFTTGWKCFFGTPDLDTGDGRSEIFELPGFPTLGEALVHLLDRRPKAD